MELQVRGKFSWKQAGGVRERVGSKAALGYFEGTDSEVNILKEDGLRTLRCPSLPGISKLQPLHTAVMFFCHSESLMQGFLKHPTKKNTHTLY